jgi:hypothetical protein
VKCRRCYECADADHHWIENDAFEDEDSPEFVCKHCDAVAFMCIECDAPVAMAETTCQACVPSPVVVSKDGGR